jgi:hypothetical protein
LRQQQRCKHAAGAKAHDDRALGQTRRRMANQVISHVGRGADVRVCTNALQQSGFLVRIGQGQVHYVDHQQFGLAGVEAALENR